MPNKYASLLNDPDVRRWFENLKSRSIITATVYLRSLGLYCELNQILPQQILAAADTKKFRDEFTDFVRKFESEGKAGSYIVRFKKVLNSWFAYNNLNVKLKVNIAGENDTPTLREERVPSKEELDKILRMASPRGRVSIALMAFCGLRPETLGNYTGTDGLRIGDLVELTLANGAVKFSRIPSMILVRKSLSKTRNQYLTFIPSQGITYLTEYLQDLLKRGEKLSKDSPVLGVDDRGARKNEFLRTTLVTRDIKEAIVRAGFQWRPYVLRAYFDTNMIIAESKGTMSHPYLQFLMGHKGDIEARYSTNKGVLSPNMIEDMRDAYKRSQCYLQTATMEFGEEEMHEGLRKALLAMSGFKREEIAELDLSNMTDEELSDLFKKRVLSAASKNGSKQKVVSEKELNKYLEDGWEYVTSISNDQAIVKIT